MVNKEVLLVSQKNTEPIFRRVIQPIVTVTSVVSPDGLQELNQEFVRQFNMAILGIDKHTRSLPLNLKRMNNGLYLIGVGFETEDNVDCAIPLQGDTYSLLIHAISRTF